MYMICKLNRLLTAIVGWLLTVLKDSGTSSNFNFLFNHNTQIRSISISTESLSKFVQ